jgi:hypothetical protein
MTGVDASVDGDGGQVGDGLTKNIRGETTFRWLPGGFFLKQRARIDFVGQQIDALELVGSDLDTFPSTVFSGFSPTPLPYRWEVRGDQVTITVAHAPPDATFTGSWVRTAPSRAAGARTPAATRP